MERVNGYQFDEVETDVIAEALAMYAGYMQEMVEPMLIGDESDADRIHKEANTARRMARTFYAEANDESWEEMATRFHEYHGRPPDINDISQFDWFERKEDIR